MGSTSIGFSMLTPMFSIPSSRKESVGATASQHTVSFHTRMRSPSCSGRGISDERSARRSAGRDTWPSGSLCTQSAVGCSTGEPAKATRTFAANTNDRTQPARGEERLAANILQRHVTSRLHVPMAAQRVGEHATYYKLSHALSTCECKAATVRHVGSVCAILLLQKAGAVCRVLDTDHVRPAQTASCAGEACQVCQVEEQKAEW